MMMWITIESQMMKKVMASLSRIKKKILFTIIIINNNQQILILTFFYSDKSETFDS